MTRTRTGLTRCTAAVALAVSALGCTTAGAYAQGRDIIFQHGFNSDGTTWLQEAGVLDNHFMISAWTPSTNWRSSLGAQADSLSRLISTADLDAILIGHSNGGLVGRTAAEPYPYLPHRPWGGIVTVGTPHTGAHLMAAVKAGDVGLWLSNAFWDAYDAQEYYYPYASKNFLFEVAIALTQASRGMALLSDVAATIGTLLPWSWPIASDMVPASAAIGTLNSSSNLSLESAAIPVRIGIVSQVTTNTGLPFHALFSNWQDWNNVKTVTEGAYNAAGFAALSYDAGCDPVVSDPDDYFYCDPDADDIRNHAILWFFAADDLSYFDSEWCTLVGALQQGSCQPSDAVVPASAQAYPGGETRNISGPSHNEETRSSQLDTELQRILEATFHIPRKTGPPPPPPSHMAVIMGTYTMRNGESCHWSAGTDIQDPVYEWQVNGSPAGSDPDLYLSASASFTLELNVSNANGDFAADAREVDVSEDYDPCADQLRKKPGVAIRPH